MRHLFFIVIFLHLSNVIAGDDYALMVKAGESERLLICKKAIFPLNDCYVGKIDILGDPHPEYVVMSDNFVALFSISGKDIRHDKLDEVSGFPLQENKGCQKPTCAQTIKAQRIPSFAPDVYDLVIQTPRGCGVISQHEYEENRKPKGKSAWVNSELMDCEQSIYDFLTKRASCKAVGSTWWVRDSTGRGSCDWPTKDAGKACTDGSQCESACVYYVKTREQFPDGDVTGVCAESRHLGCGVIRVHNGKPIPGRCS